MRASKILEHLRRKPFRPMRVHLSDGSAYEVLHPEFVAVSRIEIAIALNPGEAEVPEKMVYCDPVHVTRIELIDATKRKRNS